MVKKKGKSRKIKAPFILFIIVIGFFIIGGVFVKNVITINSLNEEKVKKEEEYKQLQEESEYLKNEIVKLNDPEYLAKFARENYDYSKDGELVIKIDKEEKVTDSLKQVNTDHEMKNIFYIVSGLFVIIAFVFIISLRKKSH